MPSVITPKVQKLQDELKQLKAEKEALDKQTSVLRVKILKIEEEITDLTVPYKRGDIVEDEKGVQYRVTMVRHANSVAGIRLTKDGHEAHKDPRTIYSTKLKKVT